MDPCLEVRRPADKTRLPEARWTPGSRCADKANASSTLQTKPRHGNLAEGQRGGSEGEEAERAVEGAAAGWLAGRFMGAWRKARPICQVTGQRTGPVRCSPKPVTNLRSLR